MVKSPLAIIEPSPTSRTPLVITFDMKSTLDDLFAHSIDESACGEDVVSKNESVNFDFSLEMLERNEFEFKEPVCIPVNSPLLKKPKNRRLRFDEASIIIDETKCANDTTTSMRLNTETADDSFQIQSKPKKKNKKLNWSSSEEESMKNQSTDAEFNEIIGNNEHYMDKYAGDFEYLDDEDEDDNADEGNRKRARRKKKSNLIMDEADESDEDRLDDDDDEEDDDEDEDDDGNQYDLKDSFVDTNDYSHDDGNLFFVSYSCSR
jgi:hypothetical protein